MDSAWRCTSAGASEPPRSIRVFDEEGLAFYEGLVEAGLAGSPAYNATQGIRHMAGHNVASALQAIQASAAGLQSGQIELKAKFGSLAKRSKTDRRIGWVGIGLLLGVVLMLVQGNLGLRSAPAQQPASAASTAPSASSPVVQPEAGGEPGGGESSAR